jgi:hypothetical protein
MHTQTWEQNQNSLFLKFSLPVCTEGIHNVLVQDWYHIVKETNTMEPYLTLMKIVACLIWTHIKCSLGIAEFCSRGSDQYNVNWQAQVYQC